MVLQLLKHASCAKAPQPSVRLMACRDLMQLAGDQRQHAPRTQLPVFRGSTGLEVANSIKRIQACTS